MPLRDRLRSLRHRRTLNITEQSDYKNVLDCLRVVGSTHAHPDAGAGAGVDDMAASSRFFNTSNTSNTNKRSATVASTDLLLDSPDVASVGHGVSTNSGPGTSKSLVNTRLKSLNEQKRKIELNGDTDNGHTDDGHSGDKETESQASSSLQKVVFNKFRRKATKQSQNLETDSSE